MESDAAATRYRSRILREMNANRENPFNSPPSSTGSHGTVSPTMTSVFSDPDGESTRKLNEDIARLTGQKGGKLQVNWEAAHRKWPEFYGMPKNEAQAAARDAAPGNNNNKNKKLASAVESKENVAPRYLAKFLDDTTENTWEGSKRTRAEMQPRVDNDSDLSSNITRSPARLGMRPELSRFAHQPRTKSPLARTHTRQPSSNHQHQSVDQVDRVDHIRKSQASPYLGHRDEEGDARLPAAENTSPKYTPSNLQTIRKSFPSPATTDSPAQNGGGATANSFFMPDISHLNELVAGKLRFNGSYKNGVPILVKHGRVHDQAEAGPSNVHAEVDGLAVHDDEEKIFVSMDMIRKEIEDLQEHDDAVQKYAGDLQLQVDQMQKELAQLKFRKSIDSALGSRTGSEPETAAQEQLISEKLVLESQVASLQSRLDQVTQRAGVNEVENNTLSLERDRALKKLQEACENIGELMDKLDTRERELSDTQKKLDATLQVQGNNQTTGHANENSHGYAALEQENKSLRADNSNLRREQQTLQEELESLRADNNSLRREHESLIAENRSLRTNARSLMTQNEELRRDVNDPERELASAKEEIEVLQQDLETMEQEKNTLKEDNNSLVRHNDKYFEENKVLRRENNGFERSIHDLHDENLNLKDEVEFLKKQLDHCRPINNDDWSTRLGHDDQEEEVEEEPEENMTSAFFVPDITIDENSVVDDPTSDTNRGPPDMATQNDKSIEIANTTGPTEISLGGPETTSEQKKSAANPQKSRKPAPAFQTKDTTNQAQKVAFYLPEDTETGKVTSNVANQGSKRKSTSRKTAPGGVPPELDPYREDSTVLSSQFTGNHSVTLDMKGKGRKDVTQESQQQTRENTRNVTQNRTNQSHHKVASKSSMKPSHSRSATVDAATRPRHGNISTKEVARSSNCPALSPHARRVLDGLCEHSCRNCVVCSRITGHRGTVSRQEMAEGKKRVGVPKPLPASENQAYFEQNAEDPTMRPSQDPGQALAMVIKGLEDEAAHIKMELARLQARYTELDSSVGRRGRKELASELKACLRRLEVKNDQIYALYDVLEGQKVAGQDMSDEELEMTVFSITGLSVRDATTSQNFTFDGVMA